MELIESQPGKSALGDLYNLRFLLLPLSLLLLLFTNLLSRSELKLLT